MSTVAKLVTMLAENHLKVTAAESCTGGLVAGAITSVSGSSQVFDVGFVTYSNDAKTKQLDVEADLIRSHGAVSEQVARAMAEGALKKATADMAVSVTGIAGPGGGSARKPVGLVYIATASKERTECSENHFSGDRDEVRAAAVDKALHQLLEMLTQKAK